MSVCACVMRSESDVDEAPATNKPYRAVWRWHFLMGLLVAPVLLLLAVTGGLYLYDSEIERLWYRDLMNVETGRVPASAAAQEAAVRRAFPEANFVSVLWPHDRTHVSTWTVLDPIEGKQSVFVDPWTARITGALPQERRLMNVISTLHGELLLGMPGDWFVELTASCTLIMMLTGLYLWWPARWRWRSVFVPRLGARGRAFWRDLHAVPSALLAVGVIFLVLSGLPWSGFWGEQLAKWGTLSAATMPTPNFRAPPTVAAKVDPHAAHRNPDIAALPWTIRQAGLPTRPADASTHASHDTITLQQVMDIATARGMTRMGPRLRVFYPDTAEGVFTLSLVPARAQDQRTVYLDPRDGGIVHDIGWKEYSPLGHAVEWGVMTHMGRQFGEPNRWLALSVCIGIVVSVIAGIVMWWRRRPRGGIGMPDARSQSLPKPLVAMMVVLGVLFPFAGAVLLLLAIGERLTAARR